MHGPRVGGGSRRMHAKVREWCASGGTAPSGRARAVSARPLPRALRGLRVPAPIRRCGAESTLLRQLNHAAYLQHSSFPSLYMHVLRVDKAHVPIACHQCANSVPKRAKAENCKPSAASNTKDASEKLRPRPRSHPTIPETMPNLCHAPRPQFLVIRHRQPQIS